VSDLASLLAQKEALENQIREIQKKERADALVKVRELMHAHGLTVADLGGASQVPRRSAAAGQRIAPKYRNPATGETWTGRGLQPKWLKAALAQGKNLSDFAL
jgi:DNA-binding protein H-NS